MANTNAIIKSGELRFISASKLLSRINSEQVKSLINTNKLDMDIQLLALQEVLAELEMSRERYVALYDFAPVGYVTIDNKGIILEMNLTGAKLIGRERSELVGFPFCAFVVRKDIRLVLNHLYNCRETGDKVTTELGLLNKGGVIVQVQLQSVPIQSADNRLCYRTVMTDITGKRKLEKELLRLEQKNIIVEMAAGIAHEVRNPMTTVRGFLQLFKGKHEYSRHQEHFDLMIKELDRANLIIEDFLSLADRRANFMNQSLNDVIKTVLPILQADTIASGNNIMLELGDIPDIRIDKKEIRQLFLNIAVNGLQAMSPGGNLTIKTYLDRNSVVLTIKDEGTGIPPQLLDKLGTPFVTTREKGTGLGLAICYSIAARHNAVIQVETGPGGSTFFIRFKLS